MARPIVCDNCGKDSREKKPELFYEVNRGIETPTLKWPKDFCEKKCLIEYFDKNVS